MSTTRSRLFKASLFLSTAATTLLYYNFNTQPKKGRLKKSMAPQVELGHPPPGHILQLDFRCKQIEQGNSENVVPVAVRQTIPKQKASLKVVQWNIERGYKLQQIIQELRKIDADILCLQELDIGCERSGYADVGREIAEALQLNYVFVCEFDEIYSDLRSPSAQGGGVHGNAIMSKFDFKEVHAVMHEHDPVNWEAPTHPFAKMEPRRGRRATMAAAVVVPSLIQDLEGARSSYNEKDEEELIMVYSAHLEIYCGILSRVHQFSEILRDAKQWIDKGINQQIIGGDLNTMGHGLARLSPYYCMDRMRFQSIGQSEARWWDRNVFSQKADVGRKINSKLLDLGLPKQVAQDALNPGFWDPWDVDAESTLDIFLFYNTLHIVRGKLDWLLLRGDLSVRSKQLGNQDYSASDHKWLLVELNSCDKSVGEEQQLHIMDDMLLA